MRSDHRYGWRGGAAASGPPSRSGDGAMPSSMLDLIWILLFFFLMISTVKRREEERSVLTERVPVAAGAAVSAERPRERIVVEITRDGRWIIAGADVSRSDLRPRLEERGARVRAGGRRPVVILDVDRRARVEWLLLAEDAARAAGLECLVRRRPAAEAPPDR